MRLFVAIDLPPDLQDYFRQVQAGLPKCNLASSFHLTLKFLGDVSDDKLNEIIQALSKIKFSKLNLSTGELGAFPSKGDIRVLWVGIEPNSHLMQLQENIENSLIGFKKDFDFYPHITLARVSQKIKFPEFKIEYRAFLASEFTLYKSTLLPTGPEYSIIQKFKGS
ncbi:MAG: RNA 2',3'-cyclic phosphodiesterase [archaeon]